MRRYACLKGLAAALLTVLGVPASAEENCLYELSGPPPSYVVLGTRVTPQSSYLVVAACNKTTEEVRADLLRSVRERAAAVEADQAERRVRRAASDEAWARMRKAQAAAEAESASRSGGWFGWLWQ
jgi:hypothetical protein